MKIILLPIAAAFALAGCSENAQKEAGEAAGAVAADANATMGEAVDDVQAASEQAFNSAESAVDSAGRAIDRGADRAGAALDDTGDRIVAGTANARREAGEELREAGNDIER